MTSPSSSTPLPFVSMPTSIASPPAGQLAPGGSGTTRTSCAGAGGAGGTEQTNVVLVTSLASSAPSPLTSRPVVIATPPFAQSAPGGTADVATGSDGGGGA